MSKFIDLTGKKFGRLTVIKRVENRISNCGQSKTMFLCKCDCGKEVCVEGAKLRNGHTQSCGCLHNEIFANIGRKKNLIHGLSNDRLYHIWEGMKRRCYQKSAKNYVNYGAKGIEVCNEWLNFEPFYNWAISNGYQENLTIDRIDVNDNYCPENCRWVDWKTQENNRSNNYKLTFNNETHTVSEWAKIINVSTSTLYSRLKRGWTVERLLTTTCQH